MNAPKPYIDVPPIFESLCLWQIKKKLITYQIIVDDELNQNLGKSWDCLISKQKFTFDPRLAVFSQSL